MNFIINKFLIISNKQVFKISKNCHKIRRIFKQSEKKFQTIANLCYNKKAALFRNFFDKTGF